MNLKHGMLAVTALALTLGTSGKALQAQSTEAEIKGVYRDGQKSGVKVVVYRGAGNDRRRVPADYEFRSGDSLELELESNQKSYVYVLNRTMNGDPARLGAMGIDRVRDDDRNNRSGERGKYKLLYPIGNDPKQTTANKAFRIGGLRMDNTPGVEKMMVVVSAKPVDLNKYFDVDGNQRSGGGGRSGRREDTEDDVLDQLNKELADWAGNAQSALPKGVVRDPEGYGVVRDNNKPAMVELSLRHFAK